MGTVSPPKLPTQGGLLEVYGSHLCGAQVSVDLPGAGDGVLSPPISISVVDNSVDERLILRLGPGVGSSVWLLLANEYGKTRFNVGYLGELR